MVDHGKTALQRAGIALKLGDLDDRLAEDGARHQPATDLRAVRCHVPLLLVGDGRLRHPPTAAAYDTVSR
jgi:hypothetical protein